MTLLPSPVSQLLTIAGVELTNSRRFLDLTDVTTMSCQFQGSLSVQIDASSDYGTTWETIIPATSYTGGNPYRCGWFGIPDDLRSDDTLIRAVGIGTGLLTTVTYVEVQYR